MTDTNNTPTIAIVYGNQQVTPMVVFGDNSLKVVFNLLKESGTTNETWGMYGFCGNIITKIS